VTIGGVGLWEPILGYRAVLFDLIRRGLLAGVVTVAPLTFKFLDAVCFRSLYGASLCGKFGVSFLHEQTYYIWGVDLTLGLLEVTACVTIYFLIWE
jgi:hypothetical protein